MHKFTEQLFFYSDFIFFKVVTCTCSKQIINFVIPNNKQKMFELSYFENVDPDQMVPKEISDQSSHPSIF